MDLLSQILSHLNTLLSKSYHNYTTETRQHNKTGLHRATWGTGPCTAAFGGSGAEGSVRWTGWASQTKGERLPSARSAIRRNYPRALPPPRTPKHKRAGGCRDEGQRRWPEVLGGAAAPGRSLQSPESRRGRPPPGPATGQEKLTTSPPALPRTGLARGHPPC